MLNFFDEVMTKERTVYFHFFLKKKYTIEWEEVEKGVAFL